MEVQTLHLSEITRPLNQNRTESLQRTEVQVRGEFSTSTEAKTTNTAHTFLKRKKKKKGQKATKNK